MRKRLSGYFVKGSLQSFYSQLIKIHLSLKSTLKTNTHKNIGKILKELNNCKSKVVSEAMSLSAP